MLKTQRMIKVGIVCPNTLLDRVVSKLYDLKVLQIEEYDKEQDNNNLELGNPLKRGEELSELLVKLRSIAAHAGIDMTKESKGKEKPDDIRLRTSINSIQEDLKSRMEKIEHYKKAQPIIKRKAYTEAMQSMKIDSPRAKDTESMMICGLVRKDVDKEIRQVSETSFVASKDVDGTKLIIILAPKAKKEDIQTILEENLFLPIDKAELKKIHQHIAAQYTDLNIRNDDLARAIIKEEKALDALLTRIRTEQERFILEANETLTEELEKCEVPIRFAASKNTHIISGWVAEERFDKVKETLEKDTKNKVFVNKVALKEHEEGPILLKNPRPANSFHFLLDLFTLPSYKEIDPTLLMFITFPLFFGFMLGDIGYGITSLIFFGLLRLKFNKGVMKALLNIMLISAVGALFFGVLFGEVFGEEEVFGYELPHIMSRAHQITDLLSLAVMIGIIHIMLGLILGFYNIAKHHGIKHAIFEKLGWLLLIPLVNWLLVNFLGVIKGVYAEFLNQTIPPFPITAGIAGVGVILILIGEGAKGAVELPAILSNILSYARLMAVGLASVELALIVNELSKELMHKGIMGLIGGIIILLLGHSINLALGLLGPFLHSLRLHYVEFFGKFYTGGGKKFTPFGEKS